MKKRILISASITVTGLVVWFISSVLLNAFSIGPNPTYDFSPKYIVVRGVLCHFPQPPNFEIANYPIEETIWSFCVRHSWLLGKTEKGFFAINMDTDETYYPVSTSEALSEKTGFQIETEDWVDEYKERRSSKYLRKNVSIQKFRMIVNYLFGIALSVLFVVLLIWIFRKPKEVGEKVICRP